MYGSGPEFNGIRNLIHERGLEDRVNLKGSAPNEDIIFQMQNHQIFLFTSDRNEGWGAVVSEAMANGCAVIASKAAGCTPYLIKDGYNGIVCNSENQEDFNHKTLDILNRRNDLEKIRLNARKTMTDLWNPTVAAERFTILAKKIMENENLDIYNEGPLTLEKKG